VRDGITPEEALALAAALARHSLHPMSRAIAAAAPAGAIAATAVQEHAGGGVVGLLPGPQGVPWRLRLGSAAFCSVEGGRAATSAVHLADDGGWLASWQLDEAPRPGAQAAIAALRRQGLQVEVLSGDRSEAVRRIADRLGIARSAGGRTPQDKLDRMAELQRAGQRVAMVGDGMNDGPVLARADVSIAVGDAVPIAQARCDFIVQGDRLDGVAVLLRQCTRARNVVRQNLAWAAGYNALCVPLAIVGAMPPWLAGLGMACSSLVVVLNAARLARLPELS
jgi:Cu2+-exporting ATPase